MPTPGTGSRTRAACLNAEPGGGLPVSVLPAGDDWFGALAVAVLEQNAAAAADGDLSGVTVLVPALPIAVELRAALLQTAGRPLLLPRFFTLKDWAFGTPMPDLPEPLAESQRLVLLHEALRSHGWFDERALWGMAAELAGLFDELSSRALPLPDDPAAFAEVLERAYALRASAPLAFEARVVHELWRALISAEAPDAPAVYRMRLAGLARAAPSTETPRPVFVVLDAPPDEALEAAERTFLERYGAHQPVHVVYPSPREARATALAAALDAAWTTSSGQPLFERAQALAERFPESPLTGRLTLVPTLGRELEAQAAVDQVKVWIRSGLRRIALIAQDRLSARRVRALLEREAILLSDETGWRLSTSRAAASVDALIETAAGQAYHRDFLDLCKSPFVFADIDAEPRRQAVFELERAIRRGSVKAGLPRIRRALAEYGGTAAPLTGQLLDRIEAATALLSAKPAPLARWIARLLRALDTLGARSALQNDVAGQALIELLETRRDELAERGAVLSFPAWRDWFNRECEEANFRDSGIASPVVLTALNAVCMRRFEAVALVGGDAKQLAPTAPSAFFGQSVRRELGLRIREDRERELRRDLELLLQFVPRVTVFWQAVQDGEANLVAPEFSLLSTLHALAWADDLIRPAPPERAETLAAADAAEALAASGPAAPRVPSGQVPARISVSAYAQLVACPYRYFARYVLGLGEMDEVAETMEKSDYGALVHRVLERFHTRHPLVSALSTDEALAALQACVAEVFAPAVADNFLAVGWRLRWEQKLPAYLDWQRAREAEGWRWAQGELRVSRRLPLEAGRSVELYGTIDRVDRPAGEEGAAGGRAALYDYKTQTAKAIGERMHDDLQLPAYALMHGEAERAAYVALDDDAIAMVTAGGEAEEGGVALAALAEAQGERLRVMFNAIHDSAPLPANGIDRVCRWCEAEGLCRKAHWAEHGNGAATGRGR